MTNKKEKVGNMARTTEVEESAVEHFLTVLCVGSYEPIVPRNFAE